MSGAAERIGDMIRSSANWNQDGRGVSFDYPNDVKIDFLLTFQCNAECAHCLTSSNPQRTEHLGLDEVVETLRAGAELGKRYAGFTGGEPFLRYPVLRRAVRAAKEYGYFVAADTNAFWGANRDTAKRIVTELREAGLDALYPSCDAYHLPWIPADAVETVIAECAAQGLPCELNFTPSPDPEVDRQLVERFQLERRGFFCDGLTLTGNDVSHLMHLFPRRAAGELHDIGSMHLGVSPRGDCYGNVDISYTGREFVGTPLLVGNLRSEPAAAILARERDEPFLRLTRRTSAAAVHAHLAQASFGDEYMALFERRRFYSPTEYWLALFTAPIAAPILERLREWGSELPAA